MARLISLLAATAILFAAPAALASGSGDCNGDGFVTDADVSLAQEAVGTTDSGDDTFLVEADMDGDGTISLNDLNAVIRAAN